MKNLIFFHLLFLLAFQSMNAQNQRPRKAYLDIHTGIGIFPTFMKDAGKAVTPPLFLAADYQIAPHFSLGAFLGYSSTESGQLTAPGGESYQLLTQQAVYGLRVAGRSSQLGPWNIYGGLSAGYSRARVRMTKEGLAKVKEQQDMKEHNGKMLLTGFLGARCQLSSRIGFFGELGYSISLATVGLSIRL